MSLCAIIKESEIVTVPMATFAEIRNSCFCGIKRAAYNNDLASRMIVRLTLRLGPRLSLHLIKKAARHDRFAIAHSGIACENAKCPARYRSSISIYCPMVQSLGELRQREKSRIAFSPQKQTVGEYVNVFIVL